MLETWPQLLVEDEDESAALRALARAAATPVGPPGPVLQCGEVLEPQFTSAGAAARRPGSVNRAGATVPLTGPCATFSSKINNLL